MRLKMLWIVAAAVLGTMVSAAPSQRAGGVSIRREAVRPKRLGSGGGDVFVRVRVQGKVRQVRAQGLVSGSGAGPIVLLNGRGNSYRGYVTVPPNFQTSTGQASIIVLVETARGTVERTVARLPILGNDGSTPPPPPR